MLENFSWCRHHVVEVRALLASSRMEERQSFGRDACWFGSGTKAQNVWFFGEKSLTWLLERSEEFSQAR